MFQITLLEKFTTISNNFIYYYIQSFILMLCARKTKERVTFHSYHSLEVFKFSMMLLSETITIVMWEHLNSAAAENYPKKQKRRFSFFSLITSKILRHSQYGNSPTLSKFIRIFYHQKKNLSKKARKS